MGIDLNLDEIKHFDFDLLKEFFENFLKITPEEKFKQLTKVKLIKDMRAYEEYLFNKFRNNDITLRSKSRL